MLSFSVKVNWAEAVPQVRHNTQTAKTRLKLLENCFVLFCFVLFCFVLFNNFGTNHVCVI